VALVLSAAVAAQGTYQVGVLPAFNFNHRLQDGWSYNLKLESRQRLQRGTFGGDADRAYEYVLTDISLLAAKKVGLSSRIAGGYLVRVREGALTHRAIQQFTVVQRMEGFRLAHRVVTDQTFAEVESPVLRLRYRLSSEIPLNGESVDPGEFYLKINTEVLNNWQSSDYDLELRLVPVLGYDITDGNKIEAGLDYRVNDFLDGGSRNSFWLGINWFIEI
jgi:hypothetical protein